MLTDEEHSAIGSHLAGPASRQGFISAAGALVLWLWVPREMLKVLLHVESCLKMMQ